MMGRWTRRELIEAASVSALASFAPMETAIGAAPMNELLDLTAVAAVGAMQRGELRAEAYATALLARAKQCAALNAFINLDANAVLEAARNADRARASGALPGPLHGLPMPIKDSVNTKDLPTTGGTAALRSFRPSADAPVIETLRSAGAIVLGKTNIHELSFGWTSNNGCFGAVHNPYDPTRVPGGSTGGTAAAVAARIAPLGLAEDTQGSIRVPAALCGIAGFRPTTGRYPTTAVVPITSLFDQVGPHARSVADLILFDTVVADRVEPLPTPSLRGVRLGIDRSYFFDGLDPEVERVTAAALKQLEAAGVVFVEVPVPDLGRLIGLTTAPIQLYDVAPSLTRYLAQYHTNVSYEQLIAAASPDIRSLFQSFVPEGSPLHVSTAVYEAARDVHIPALRETFRRWFADTGVAALVFPTVRIAATPIGQDPVDIGGRPVPFGDAVGRNIASGSTAGLPGLVLPSGLTNDGLPVSIEFDGPAGSDRRLLALGLAIEQALGPLPAPAA
jgi:Asp-tRNA(Asn)/Glu-tRNA(Gln) amidotransferase A subunit family amidase